MLRAQAQDRVSIFGIIEGDALDRAGKGIHKDKYTRLLPNDLIVLESIYFPVGKIVLLLYRVDGNGRGDKVKGNYILDKRKHSC